MTNKGIPFMIHDYFKSLKNIGIIFSIADGIVGIKGLFGVCYGEMINFCTKTEKTLGLILNLENKRVFAIILGSINNICRGDYVSRTYVLMRVPTGDFLVGKVVDPLGKILSDIKKDSSSSSTKFWLEGRKVERKWNYTNKPSFNVPALKVKGLGSLNLSSVSSRFMESKAPSIITRSPVNRPLETGLKVIDSMVPIGHGQRELIIGDSKTGKSSIAIDTIINQKDKDVICIYVAIGQKRSSVARIHDVLLRKGCMHYSIIVAATASDSAALQYIAPYSGCSMGEFFMNNGLRVLCIYDDLSKHAISYRQLSLLLRRPPGREGYPGDVFYLHSRLLERAANLRQGGSLTSLPVIETIQGDVSAYIPTNVISITDGQIFLEKDLFTRGIRPAVSPGLSVSRVGSAAQNKVIKSISGSLKLELAQFREVEDFTKLGFVLDDVTKRLVDRGERLTRLLVQNRFSPLSITDQYIFLYAALKGFLDDISVNMVSVFEYEFFSFLKSTFIYKPLSYHLIYRSDKKVLDFLLNCFKESFLKIIIKK